MLVSFEAPAARLASLLPPACELDQWAGRHYVSLVALQMDHVRIRGLAFPGVTAYPQVNLRFYLRHAGQPAVCFVQELVPNRLLAAGAKWLYGEPFRAGYIRAHLREGPGGATAEYRFGLHRPSWQLRVVGHGPEAVPADGTFEHWIKERVRGCRGRRHGRLRTFDVTHPRWAVRQVDAVSLEVRFGELYGADWAFLDGGQPASVLYAVGSEVAVSAPS